MYVLMSPCITDPSCRAAGITTDDDLEVFSRAVGRCERFGIEIVTLPCPETLYSGKERQPTTFEESLDTPAFSALLDDLEEDLRALIRKRGPPLCIIGVDSSPCCGVRTTYRTSEKEAGRGAFIARFPEHAAFDVREFAAYRVYLAAPLFSEAEQNYNLVLHDLLTSHLFDVYLPQEVGDTSRTRDRGEQRQIFDLHLRVLMDADIVVAVVDGADADSGTSWEMGYAYALGKQVIALRTDFRSAGHHEHVNLMLEESAALVTRKEDLPVALRSPLA